MATYNTPLITTQGLSLLKAEIAGNDSVTFTKIVFSSDDYSQTADSSVQALTALSSLDLTATARSFTDVNGNLKIRGVANNQNTTSAFYIKTYGLYGKNKAGNEMLIAVSTAQNANFVPAYNNKQTNQIAYTFNIAVSSTNNITLSSSTDVDVTQADLAGINNAVNSNASSLTAQQSSYASSLNSAFSANSSNASSYVSSTANSLTSYVSSNVGSMQSQVSSNASNISSNASAITALSNASITYQGKISNFNQGSKQGLYKYFDGTTSSTLTVVQYNDVIIQTRVDTWDANGAAFSDDDYSPKMRLSADGGNTWSAWSELATQYDVQAIESTSTSLASSLAVQNSAISSSVSANSSAISTLQSSDSKSFKYYGTYDLGDLGGKGPYMPTGCPLAKNGGYMFITFKNGISGMSGRGLLVVTSNVKDVLNVKGIQPDTQYKYIDTVNNQAWVWTSTPTDSNGGCITSTAQRLANTSDINQLTTTITGLTNQVNTLQSNSLQYQGVWQGHYWDWGSHKDGIYTIDQGQNPLDSFFNGPASNFSGWGTLTLTSTTNGNDRYCVLQDNVNHMFRNHLFVIPATFSGWVQY